MKLVAVIDGTRADAARQARALGGFLREGLSGDVAAETWLFRGEGQDMASLVSGAPTRDVRVLRSAARAHDHMASVLAAALASGPEGEEPPGLFLFAGGPGGTELGARLAARAGGAVLSGALSGEILPDRLIARRSVYSGHLVGRFELTARPWCVTIDAIWDDAPVAGPGERRLLSADDVPGGSEGEGERALMEPPLDDLEVLTQSSADDLADARLLVVAGRGLGSREAMERAAAAARSMGAAFGVTRPVAMNAWASMDRLVGVSGARTAPSLCIAVGVSGAPALLWGIERARFIVAINTDDAAPMVADADAALIGDGLTILEELAELMAWRSPG